MKIAILIAIIACTACTPLIQYTKPGGDQEQYKRDLYDCEAKNRTGHPAMMLVDLQNAYTCMEMEKGWVKQ